MVFFKKSSRKKRKSNDIAMQIAEFRGGETRAGLEGVAEMDEVRLQARNKEKRLRIRISESRRSS